MMLSFGSDEPLAGFVYWTSWSRSFWHTEVVACWTMNRAFDITTDAMA